MIKRKPCAPADAGRIPIDIELPASARRTGGLAGSGRAMDEEAIACYLADMIAQLESLARAANNDMLAYLLSMASVQAVRPGARTEGSNALH